jgi:hypothetical protein
VGDGYASVVPEDEALMVVLALAVVVSAATALVVVSAGRLVVTTAIGEALMMDRNAHRRTKSLVGLRK